jgi:hypothetical protein
MFRRTLWAVTVPALLALIFPAGAWATTKPDMRISEMTVERVNTVSVPLRVKVRLRTHNYGDSTGAASFVTRLSYRQKSSDPWQPLQEWTSGAVGSGGGAIYEKTFDLPITGYVSLTFQGLVDATNKVDESSESNNTRTTSKSFYAGVPDLTIENLTAAITSVSSSGTWNTRVEFDLANVGTGRAVGSCVTVLKVSKSSGSFAELSRWTSSNLDPGKKVHYTKTSSFSNVTSLKFQAVADEIHQITEVSQSNNTVTSSVIKP